MSRPKSTIRGDFLRRWIGEAARAPYFLETEGTQEVAPLNPHILPFRFEISDIVGSFRNTRFDYGYFPPKRRTRSSIRRVILGMIRA
jgi:hypothetical protein